MQRMSFVHGQAAFLAQMKTVTRRLRWRNLKPGTKLLAVDRASLELEKGEHVKTFGVIRVVSVRRERLDAITEEDVEKEGFPERSVQWFVEQFCYRMDCQPRTEVTRIEFEHLASTAGEQKLERGSGQDTEPQRQEPTADADRPPIRKKSPMTRARKLHPVASLMPPMRDEEYQELADSIEAEGLKIPIVLDDKGLVLDGIHRQRACLERGIEPRFETRDLEGEDAIEFVWACNAARRHLESGQRAALRTRINGELDRIRKSRRKGGNSATKPHAGRSADNQSVRGSAATDPRTVRPEPAATGRTRDVIAQAAGCSARTAAKAMAVADRDPELHDKVCQGEVSLESAYKQVRRAAEQSGKASELAIAEAEAAEHRTTPDWVVWSLLGSSCTQTRFRDLPTPAIDPFAGEGQIPVAMSAILPAIGWELCELRPSCRDVLAERCPQAEVTIGDFFADDTLSQIPLRELTLAIFNPPFSLALEAVQRLILLAKKADIWMLQRRNWIDQARAAWLRDHVPDEYVVPKRIKFGQAASGDAYQGTDNCSHCWYHWPADGRNRRQGTLAILDLIESADDCRKWRAA